ncbi:glycoside hydrolase family protein [Phenylobacterium sp. LjRoot225]|uniref:lysozyme n=1 Tax=Phenylobacterium sp. LjRoot225 TaxID=3342285 RepID=UPI003ECC6112
MTPRHQVSRTAIELIKRFEGYRRKAAQLPDGRWTIGYGHTLTARAGAEVCEADAEALLLYDLIGVAHTVSELTYADLTQNQFDALCAFALAIGLDAFRGSDVLKRVNEGAFTQAAFAMELWRKAEFEGQRIVIDALVRRRAAEKLLFLTPAHGAWRAAPSAVLKPLLDEDAIDTAPRSPPARVVALLEGEAVEVVREDNAPPEAVLAPVLETESPVRAAAEAVTARLQTLFADPPEPLFAEEATVELEAVDAAAPLDEPVAPEADAEPATPAEAAAAEGEPIETSDDDALAEAPIGDAPAPDGEPAQKLFDEAPPADRPAPRVIIDDTSPYEFVPAPVQPIDAPRGDSLLMTVCLIILGLAFFAGGVFWALNAPPQPRPGVFTPLLVGWLAGVAGVGFVAVAVFMLLQRVTRAAERR